MKAYFQKSTAYIIKHKIISGIVLIVLVFAGYQGVKAFSNSSSATTYVLGMVERGTITASVTGTGQVSASNQIDMKSKVSGDVLSVTAKSGDTVKKGDLIARIDAGDAQTNVTDAKNSLRSAQISLEKLLKGADESTLVQSKNALASAQQSQTTAESNLAKSYDDGFNTTASTFLDLQTTLTSLETILARSYIGDNTVGNQYGDTAKQYKSDAEKQYYAANKKYKDVFTQYKQTTRDSDSAAIESLITNTADATRETAEAVKELNTLLDYVENHDDDNVPADLSSDQTTLDSYQSKMNGHVTDLVSAQNAIKNGKDDIADAKASIQEKDLSLQDVEKGSDPLDVENARLTVAQREASLQSAQEKLTDYTIRAPFDGIIASVDVKTGDSVSSGDALATVVTQQKIATVSLNEVDIAKIKTGQKATLTFDAVDGLSITGEVISVDMVGTISQGVVSYDVDIGFDTDDDRIKPGMSVSAAIITDIKQDVLYVPTSAVKTQGDISYVEQFPANTGGSGSSTQIISETAPQQTMVTTGLSDDTDIEIVSGLSEGDKIVTRTISSSAKTTTTTSAPSLFGGGGGTRTGGNAGGAAIRLQR